MARWKKKPTKAQLELMDITPRGYARDECVSALQKEIRRGRELEAVWWAMELVEMGDVDGLWRRLCVIAAEDVGMGDPEALEQFNICLSLFRRARGSHGDRIIITLAILRLARAKKNREANMLTTVIQRMRENGETLPIPDYARDTHTKAGRARFSSDAEAFAWWIEVGQRCENTVGPNRYLEQWVRLHGKKVGMTKSQMEEAIRTLKRQYRVKNG